MKIQPLQEAQLLALIGEELKSHHLFHTFATLGFDYTFYRPDLSAFILHALALPDDDDTFAHYYDTMQHHGHQLKPNRQSLKKQSTLVLRKLLRYQRRHL